MSGLKKGVPSSESFVSRKVLGSIINYAISRNLKGYYIPLCFSPDSVSDSVQASFNQTAIPGGSAPQITYSNTGARQVSFSITLPLDYIPPNSSYTSFEEYLDSFRALVYPKYLSSGKVESPHCRLSLSNIILDGVCSNCSIEYKTDRVAEDGSMAAVVSLSFMEVLGSYVSIADAAFIANSKSTISNSNISNTSISLNTEETYTGPELKAATCSISLLGPERTSISSSGGLKTANQKGRWFDQGVTYTNEDYYTVKKFYGCVDNGPVNAVYSINIDPSGNNHYCTVDSSGKVKVKLQASLFDSNVLYVQGQVNTYFIIYVPLSNANKYETNSFKVRYIEIKMV